MELEGNNYLKPPCNGHEILNKPDPSCTTGAPWNSAHAQKTMAGDLNGVTLDGNNNFHRVYSVDPVHLPYFTNTCESGDSSCVVHGVSVT